jgi:hypothetical protein
MEMLTKFQHVCMCILRNIEFLISFCLLSKLLDRALVNEFFGLCKSWICPEVEYQCWRLWNSTHDDQNSEFFDTWAERYGIFSDPRPGFFLPTVAFLPLGGGNGSYRGIPLNTARIQISNQNRLKPLVQTVWRGIPQYKPFIPRYKLFIPRYKLFIPLQIKRSPGFE